MRLLLAAVGLCLGSAAHAQTFEITNRMPQQFTVVNRMPVVVPPDDPYRLDYADFYRMVGNGITGWLAVGVDDPWVDTYLTHCRVPAGFGGLPTGLYRCYSKDGRQVVEPWKEDGPKARPFLPGSPTTPRTTAPSAVAPSTSFPAPARSPGATRTLAPLATPGGINGCASPFG